MSKGNKKSDKQQQGPISPKAYIRQAGRKLALEAVYVNRNWREGGIANFIVVRRKPNGFLVGGIYLVDLYCLGLKNTFFQMDMTDEELQVWLDKKKTGGDALVTIDPALAFNVIYGAIEYAEDLGLQAHADFDVTEYLLPPVEEVPFIEIEFGLEGVPHFFSGPSDNVGKILATLRKNLGEDGFEYTAFVGD
jgi:hypothetical protein